jgi:hypothetical protein
MGTQNIRPISCLNSATGKCFNTHFWFSPTTRRTQKRTLSANESPWEKILRFRLCLSWHLKWVLYTYSVGGRSVLSETYFTFGCPYACWRQSKDISSFESPFFYLVLQMSGWHEMTVWWYVGSGQTRMLGYNVNNCETNFESQNILYFGTDGVPNKEVVCQSNTQMDENIHPLWMLIVNLLSSSHKAGNEQVLAWSVAQAQRAVHSATLGCSKNKFP